MAVTIDLARFGKQLASMTDRAIAKYRATCATQPLDCFAYYIAIPHGYFLACLETNGALLQDGAKGSPDFNLFGWEEFSAEWSDACWDDDEDTTYYFRGTDPAECATTEREFCDRVRQETFKLVQSLVSEHAFDPLPRKHSFHIRIEDRDGEFWHEIEYGGQQNTQR